MDKIALTAGATVGARLSGSYFGVLVAPHVKGKQSAPNLLHGAHQQLDGFGGGNRRGPQVYGR